MTNQETLATEKAKSKKLALPSITPAQLRAARALLDWTRAELAKSSGLFPETIKNIEHGIFKPTKETIERIFTTFAERGVEFFIQQGSFCFHGVVLKSNAPVNDEDDQQQTGTTTEWDVVQKEGRN